MTIPTDEEEIRKANFPNQQVYPSLVTPQDQPLNIQPFQIEGYKPPPDWTDTVGAAFRQYNDIYRLGEYAYDFRTPFGGGTTRAQGYDPIEEGLLDDVPVEFHMQILEHRNREDALIAIRRVSEQMADQETLARSGTGLMMVSTLGATLASPTTLIPAAQTIKYADASKGVFMNALRTAQTMGPAIAMQNLAVIGTKETETMSDWAYQTIFDTAVTSAVGGLMGRFASKNAAKDLDNMRAFINAAEKDIDIKYQVNNKGEIIKPVAVAKMGGVGAAEVKAVQDLLDSGQVAWRNNKLVRNTFKWASPMVEGLTNRFDVVRRVTTEMFPTAFELAGGALERIQGHDFYSWAKKWYGLHQNLLIEENVMWQQYLGLKGVGKGARAEIGAWTGKWISKEEFSELIAKARRRGNMSSIPEVEHMAKRYTDELYKPLFNELQKRFPTITEHEFSNITEWLNRSYNRKKIAQDPVGFENMVKDYLVGKNQRLEEQLNPIQTAENSIKLTREAITDAKNKLKKPVAEGRDELLQKLEQVEKDLNNLYVPSELAEGATDYDKVAHATAVRMQDDLRLALGRERDELQTLLGLKKASLDERILIESEIRQLEATLTQQREQLNAIQADLDMRIRNGEVDLDLLDGKSVLNNEEFQELQKLNEPITTAETELKVAKLEETKLGTIKNFEEIKLAGKSTADLEEIINDAANDFSNLGQEQALHNITRSRNELIRRRDSLKHEIDLKKADYILEKMARKGEAISVNEATLAAELDALKAELSEIQDSLKSTRETYNNVKSLLKQEGISVADFQDLMQATRKTSKKLQAEVKGSELENLRLRKEKARERVKAAEKNLASANEDLFNKIESGKVPEKFYYKTASGYKLADMQNTPKLRAPLHAEEIGGVANSIRLNITNMNDEQVAGAIFDDIASGGSNPLKNRVFLAKDDVVEPWLNNRMSELSGLYTDQLVKRIYMEDFLKGHGVDAKEGMNGIVRKLTTERNVQEAKILEIADEATRKKQLNRLNSDFEKAQKLLENYYKIFMGNYVDRSTLGYKVSDGVKKFAVATLLGNLPLLLTPEFVTPLFRMAMTEYINDGIVPAIKRMQYLIGQRIEEAGGKNIGYIRGSYADVGLGVNRYIGNRIQAMAGYGAEYQPKTVAGRWLENIANFSQQFSLANYIMDFQEVTVSTANESRLIRSLKRWASGEELTRFEIDMLDRARLNPTKKILIGNQERTLGEAILEQFAKHGKDDGGGFVPNFHLWDSFEAATNFELSVEKLTRESLVRPGPLDVPFAFRDPVVSMVTQFTSYVFAATNNFTIPLLTAPDKQKVFGTLMMLAAGALVDPLRQLTRGEEPDLKPESLLIGALTNSAVFGIPVEGMFKLNAFIDWEPTRFLQSDRMKSKTLTIGPASGLYNMLSSGASAVLNGEMNKQDLNRILKLGLGFGYNWWDRKLFDIMIDSTNLPANRKEAKARKAVGE